MRNDPRAIIVKSTQDIGGTNNPAGAEPRRMHYHHRQLLSSCVNCSTVIETQSVIAFQYTARERAVQLSARFDYFCPPLLAEPTGSTRALVVVCL